MHLKHLIHIILNMCIMWLLEIFLNGILKSIESFWQRVFWKPRADYCAMRCDFCRFVWSLVSVFCFMTTTGQVRKTDALKGFSPPTFWNISGSQDWHDPFFFKKIISSRDPMRFWWSDTVPSVSRKRAKNVTAWYRMYENDPSGDGRTTIHDSLLWFKCNPWLCLCKESDLEQDLNKIFYCEKYVMNWMTAIWVANMDVIPIVSFSFKKLKQWQTRDK